MRVHLIKEKTIEDYVIRHVNGRSPFWSWMIIVKAADWNSPEDIKRSFGSADLLATVRTCSLSNMLAWDTCGIYQAVFEWPTI